jgi:hypothetical protein
MEALFMIAFVACPLILWSLFLTGAGRWYWFITMSLCLLSVLIFEAVSKLTTGHSISQLYWIWSLEHPWTAVATQILLSFGWVMLQIHLLWKLIRKYILKQDVKK